uniref:Uncharacterized protein n=1 Tax=Chromera velia CCMP2878 TaxID=1169474 RepID=A0A0G4GZV5_9ALVE|eukprot:Cvel_5475.t1-p1 / transcript=Cvel_5475.t1 / gene=Cvel_5475 / organism=Chromera_velia_CCMP2878 / gene_product=hypothetical protein / transcript_product=hypothetical protein / location=Cvel_scaffold256:32132-34288(-) / protein_length=247 / sequence_SO=supercontig / SO=protein_coding / is_pseudo=false
MAVLSRFIGVAAIAVAALAQDIVAPLEVVPALEAPPPVTTPAPAPVASYYADGCVDDADFVDVDGDGCQVYIDVPRWCDEAERFANEETGQNARQACCVCAARPIPETTPAPVVPVEMIPEATPAPFIAPTPAATPAPFVPTFSEATPAPFIAPTPAATPAPFVAPVPEATPAPYVPLAPEPTPAPVTTTTTTTAAFPYSWDCRTDVYGNRLRFRERRACRDMRRRFSYSESAGYTSGYSYSRRYRD